MNDTTDAAALADLLTAAADLYRNHRLQDAGTLLCTQAARIAALEAEVAEWRKLRDTTTLHVNLLRGMPASLSRETFLHLAGDGAALEARKVPAVPEGFKLIAVKGFDELVQALDRADRKGYIPDAVADEWAAFDYRLPAAPTAPAPKS
jgi:hypothetical protein